MAERAAEISELKKKLRHASRAPGRQVDATELAQLRRDAKDAQRELATLRESLQRPSFQRALDDLRRTVVTLRSVDREKAHPLRQLPFKLRNYRLAMSHGIAVPEIYGTWAKVDDIDFTLLPHEFVLKSDGGAGGHGVLPLRRRAHRQFELISTDTVLSEDDVRRRIREAKSLSGPYFAEELLGAPESTGLPEDLRVLRRNRTGAAPSRSRAREPAIDAVPLRRRAR